MCVPKGICSLICLQISTALHQADAPACPNLENECSGLSNITERLVSAGYTVDRCKLQAATCSLVHFISF